MVSVLYVLAIKGRGSNHIYMQGCWNTSPPSKKKKFVITEG